MVYRPLYFAGSGEVLPEEEDKVFAELAAEVGATPPLDPTTDSHIDIGEDVDRNADFTDQDARWGIPPGGHNDPL